MVKQAADKLKSLAVTWLSRENLRAAAEWLREPVLMFGAIYLIAAAVIQPFYVPSGSMQPTLAIGDLLLVTKYSYGLSRYSLPFFAGSTPQHRLFGSIPQRGDVVVFRTPGEDGNVLVKRVIGLPGDRIQMRDGKVWINGRALPLEPAGIAMAEDGPTESAPGVFYPVPQYIQTLPNLRKHYVFKRYGFGGSEYDDTSETVVPPGDLFVMGDNRDDSADSRVPRPKGVGFLPAANLMGRVRLVVASVDFVNAHGIWEWPFRLRWKRTLSAVR